MGVIVLRDVVIVIVIFVCVDVLGGHIGCVILVCDIVVVVVDLVVNFFRIWVDVGVCVVVICVVFHIVGRLIAAGQLVVDVFEIVVVVIDELDCGVDGLVFVNDIIVVVVNFIVEFICGWVYGIFGVVVV